MRVPLRWLRHYSDPSLGADRLAERLAMTGTEVERVESHGVDALEHFVVGQVLSADRHPEADRLSVCVVNAGEREPRKIVCGAPNVSAGQTVAVATPGAVMPDGTTLGKVKLRGVESDGMILAEDELAIGTEHDGILELEGDNALPGTPLAELLEISTDVLVLEITPNRPDCLSIYGVAREVHAATGAPLSPPPWREDPGTTGPIDGATVEVKCPELCPRFTARVFEDVTIGPSPAWLKARLMAAGQRPISNVVDITNYVMLLTGQPLHAFDLDRVAGQRLVVRRARDREEVQTLDGQLRTLDSEMVVIEDDEGPTSIAGVMGGARSEVAGQTTRVLMEAANWNGPNVHRTSLKLGLRSEASARFEKQLQPEQALDAQAVATQLMIELCGARVLPGTIDVGGPGPVPELVRVREARVSGLLGVGIPVARQREILEALEFEVGAISGGLEVRPPEFRRADVTREADVIEEIARLGALDQLPATVPATHRAAEAALARGAGLAAPGRLTPRQHLRRRAADVLVAAGLSEILGWSFTGPDLARRLRLSPEEPELELENPMSIEHSRLRRTLLGSLLDATQRNRAQGASRVAIFDTGAVFLPREDRALPDEPYHVGGLLLGSVRPPTWRDPQPPGADFFAVQGVLSGLLKALRTEWRSERSQEPFLHPGRRATISIGGRAAGWLGEIHPLVAGEWEIDRTVAAFELDLDAVAEAASPGAPAYRELSSFPDVREDLAVVVRDDITAAQVVDVARRSGGKLLVGVDVFDVYRDAERLGEGNVSLALRLSFRATDRTLTDEEVATQRRRIVDALADELSGTIRAS
jgi:phenylalanyl-tRNA synthetase beta chain